MLSFIRTYQKELALLTGLLFFLLILFGNPLEQESKANMVLAVAALMVSWWILEALPLPVVALVPIVLFPLLGISPVQDVTKSYADSMIF
ncbi:MAG TPA: anion permease, partial [Ferruginibacter sp.]|nr:anion permease [Ferruginibacter sp.]